MTDDKRTIADLAKLLTEAQQENKRLRAENEKLRSKAAQWQCSAKHFFAAICFG